MTLKQKIKSILPDRMIYIIDVLKLFPTFILNLIEDKFKNNKKIYNSIKILDDDNTIDLICNKNMSISRFGDGELRWMDGQSLNSYQEYSSEFAKDLKTAFNSKNSNLLIGIPVGLINSKGCKLYSRMHWICVRNKSVNLIKKYIDPKRIYCNASITRPYIDYKKYKFSEERFKKIKKIWEKRDIVIIEGAQTKLGIGNDLFDNAKSIQRIICPAENAYSIKDDIINYIKDNVSNNKMLLGALGPTASILANELSYEGFQFIDIGHIDIEYMWFLKKCIIRKNIEGKYVNEIGMRHASNKYDNDIEYLNSIMIDLRKK